jgi:hypothetical protein
VSFGIDEDYNGKAENLGGLTTKQVKWLKDLDTIDTSI